MPLGLSVCDAVEVCVRLDDWVMEVVLLGDWVWLLVPLGLAVPVALGLCVCVGDTD